jgi:hypothetical protein
MAKKWTNDEMGSKIVPSLRPFQWWYLGMKRINYFVHLFKRYYTQDYHHYNTDTLKQQHNARDIRGISFLQMLDIWKSQLNEVLIQKVLDFKTESP